MKLTTAKPSGKALGTCSTSKAIPRPREPMRGHRRSRVARSGGSLPCCIRVRSSRQRMRCGRRSWQSIDRRMASLKDVRHAAQQIVGPICGNKPRSFAETDIRRILHAYLLGKFGGVKSQCPVRLGQRDSYIDFRFGDAPYGNNPCVLELVVRNTQHGPQLSSSQNQTELKKLSRYPTGKAQTRVLLLLDLGHMPLAQATLQRGYDKLKHLGAGKFQRRAVQVLYVHRDLDFHFSWKPI